MAGSSGSTIQTSYKDDLLLNFTPGKDTSESFVNHLYYLLKTYGDEDIHNGKEIRSIDSISYSNYHRGSNKTFVDRLYDALKPKGLKKGKSLRAEVIRSTKAKSTVPTSASSIQKSFKYDVFLSFRGEDTRKNFVDHLYYTLKERGIYMYKDDTEIQKGKRINDELIRSIEDSKIHIIIFSKNYASSSWCLDELVKIMECQKTNEHIAYPVFYDVEPTEVRKQSGAVEIAFAKHSEEECAGKWRKALTEAANLAGWELKTTFDGYEAMFIQQIVKKISQELRYNDLSVDTKLIGMEKRVKHVVSSLKVDIDDNRMIGIKGIGGGGKTTLAKAVFDKIYHLYEGSSFVENVRESSKVCSLKLLQKQVISAVLDDPHLDVGGAPDLKMMMQKKLKCRKVLIVLDDVDHIDQLEALVGDLNWFGPGSLVIVTTRDKQVLDAQGVPNNFIIDVSLLSFDEAKRLFNRYAFGREISDHGFKILSDQFVKYAGGLPLMIKVLGSLLRGKDKLEWTDELERLKTIPLMETLKVLELSYNSLEEDHKEIFLDVACILKGWQKEKAIRSLESRGYHARSGLKVLEQKSLITVSDGGYLSMHDHIEEMGKNIVRRSYPNEPCKHSRLWIKEEVMDILTKEKGTEATRCISIWRVNPLIVMKGLRKMKELRILQVDEGFYNNYGWLQNGLDDEFNEISEDSLYLPNSLQYISWNCYPFTCLPESFQANNLVGLEMQNSKMDQLWNGDEKKHPEKLRFISLNGCELRSLDIGLFLNLERLILQDCRNFVEFRMPVRNFKLKFLSLCNCKLTTLDLALARDLETLTVEQCQDLIKVHLPLESLHLKDLHIKVCSKLKTLNLTRAHNLETLTVVTCENLVKLHMHAEMLKLKYVTLLDCSKLKTLNVTWAWNLEVLDVIKCEDLVDFHMPVEMLKLEHLTVFRCSKVKTLNLRGTRNLEVLEVIACEDLDVLHMPIETPKLKHVMLLRCFKLKTLSLTKTPNLKVLDVINNKELKTLYLGASPYLKILVLRHCYNLVEIHTPIKELEDSLQIDIIGCARFNPSLFNKGYPMVLAELHLIIRSLSTECELHLDGNLHELEFECIYKEPPPGNRKKFIYVNLCTCTNLASFLGSTYVLQCLRKLTFEGSFQEVLIEPDQLQCLS